VFNRLFLPLTTFFAYRCPAPQLSVPAPKAWECGVARLRPAALALEGRIPMLRLSKAVLSLVTITFLIGCAGTYQPPSSIERDFTRTINGSKEAIINAAKQVLILEGYQIVSSDKHAGVISTGKRQMNLTENECDCGTTMGLPYIKDKRTITNVSIGIVVAENRITIKSTIEGEYLKGDVTQGIDLHCVSTGKIEEALFNKVVKAIR